MKHVLPALPYDFAALEPHIDAQTMQIHHDKHHAAYVDKLNAALEKYPEISGNGIEDLLMSVSDMPEDIKTAVRNNGGGHWNHSFFWEIMSPNAGGEPSGDLAAAINDAFGSFADFKVKFAEAATGRFGSGWAWLVKKEDGILTITSTPNQDNPIMDVVEVNGTPVIGLDIWEHAYYLKYQNKRADYITAWWNVVNWNKAAENFAQ